MEQDQLLDYLTSISNKKDLNITTSLERIKLLRNILSLHGANLGLNLSKSSPTVIAETDSTLEDVVKEYNKIKKQLTPTAIEGTSENAIAVDLEHQVIINPGYYSEGFVVTGQNAEGYYDELLKEALDSLKRELLDVVTSKDNVLNGVTNVAIVENPQTGELEITSVTGTVGKPFNGTQGEEDCRVSVKNKANDDTVIIQSKSGIEIYSDIPYFSGGKKEVEITVSTTSDNETVLETVTLDKGYYDSTLEIIPVLKKDPSVNKVVNVETDKKVTVNNSVSNIINPSEGFDYIKNITVDVKEGSSKVKASAKKNGIVITPSNTAGWVENTEIEAEAGLNITHNDSDNTYEIVFESNKPENSNAVIDTSKDNLHIIPTEGYYSENTSIQVLLGDSPVKSISKQDINDGIIPQGIIINPIDLGESSLSVTDTEIQNADEVKITKPVTYIQTNEGYTKGQAKKLVIESTTPVLTTKKVVNESSQEEEDIIIINFKKDGWASGQTDVTRDFVVLADMYANSLIDNTGGIDSKDSQGNVLEVSTDGQALFTYADNLAKAKGGLQVKVPNGRFFTSAKVDLSDLIDDINNI